MNKNYKILQALHILLEMQEAEATSDQDQEELSFLTNEEPELKIQRTLSETQEEDIKPDVSGLVYQEEYGSFSTAEEPEPKPNNLNMFTELVKNEVISVYRNFCLNLFKLL